MRIRRWRARPHHCLWFLTLYLHSFMRYEEALEALTVKELLRAVGPHLSHSEKHNRQEIINVIQECLWMQEEVFNAYEEKKERAIEDQVARLKRCRLDMQGTNVETPDDQFMEHVENEVRDAALSAFIERTGNRALSHATCVVCAGEFSKMETIECNLAELEHKEILSPPRSHARQQFTLGMLLYKPAVYEEDGALFGRICEGCWEELSAGKLPNTALANNLWIREVPRVLSILSLPEQVLVSRYHAAAHIIKLYPRSWASQSSSGPSFNSGLRGNVSSYHLNTSDVAAMVDGELLPHHPNILSAIIGVSIIGSRHPQNKALPPFLHVSRRRVRDALSFLIANNPFYGNVHISEFNLNLLPENGVPDELTAVIRESSDSEELDKEHDGYVLNEDDVDNDSFLAGE